MKHGAQNAVKMRPAAFHSWLEYNVDKADAIKRRSKNPVGIQKQTQSHLIEGLPGRTPWRRSCTSGASGMVTH